MKVYIALNLILLKLSTWLQDLRVEYSKKLEYMSLCSSYLNYERITIYLIIVIQLSDTKYTDVPEECTHRF